MIVETEKSHHLLPASWRDRKSRWCRSVESKGLRTRVADGIRSESKGPRIVGVGGGNGVSASQRLKAKNQEHQCLRQETVDALAQAKRGHLPFLCLSVLFLP